MDFVKYGVDLTLKQRKGEKIDAVKEYINKMPVNQLACPIFKIMATILSLKLMMNGVDL